VVLARNDDDDDCYFTAFTETQYFSGATKWQKNVQINV